MVLQFPASFANQLDEALKQIEVITKENRNRIETLDEENKDLQKENGELKQEKITLREEIEKYSNLELKLNC